MKKFTLLLIIMASVMFAEMPEIAPQRMVTDYIGIAYNDDIILCYGNFGIITYTTDLGKTWGRINIGDKHNIRKILNNDDYFVAHSGYSYFISENGIEWDEYTYTETNVPEEIAVGNKNIFIKNNNKIYKSDFEMNFQEFLSLDNNTYDNLIFKDDELFFLKNEKSIIKIDIQSKEINTITVDFNEEYELYSMIDTMYLFDSRIYCRFNNESGKRDIYEYENTNDSFEMIHEKPPINEPFIVDNRTLFKVKNFIKNKHNEIQYFSPFFPVIEKGKNLDDYEVVSDTSDYIYKNSRLFANSFLPLFSYNDLKKINDSTFITVGDNSLIAISKDKGKTLKPQSYIQSYSRTALSPFFTDRNNIFSYALAEPNIYKSTNGGVTFLPQYYNHDMAVIASGGRSEGGGMVYHNNNGLIFYYYNYYKTNDFGDTYTNHEYPSSKLSRYTFNSYVINNNEYVVNFSSIFTGNYTMIFDESLNVTDTIRNDSISVLNIFNKENGNLLALSFHRRGYEETEDSYKYNDIGYKMVESDDNGRTWNELQIDVPFQERKTEKGISNIYMSQYRYGDYILIPKFLDSSHTVYTFDMNTEKFDSLQLPNLLNKTSEIRNMFIFQNKLHYISNNYQLMWAENFGDKQIIWDSLDLTQYFHKWDSFDTFEVAFNKDCILGAWADSTQIYLIKGISKKAEGGITFYINPVKLFKEELPTSVVELPQTETQNYLYTYPPYPQPASTEVRSLVYWDTSLEMNTERVKIYNTNGVEVGIEQDISFERINAYSGNLIWNCTNVPDGVYLIQISHGDKKRTIKVMVRK